MNTEDPSLGPRGIKVPQHLAPRLLLILTLLWLVVAIVLPVATIFHRSVHAEVPVAIWGPEDVRIGGRQVALEDSRVVIDGGPIDAEGTAINYDGFALEIGDAGFRKVTCSRVLQDGRPIDIRPIVIEIEGDLWKIDGAPLAESDYQAVVNRSIGFALFWKYFSNPNLYNSLLNSITVALITTVLGVFLAFVYAYALTRTCMTGKALYRLVAMLPIFAPTMLFGLSLVYLFGNKGVITTGFFGHIPWLATDIGLYGLVGIVIAEVAFTFPAAVIILTIALSNTDARLYEAASILGASRMRTFFTVTLPGVKYGLLNALFVCFTLSFTDFGAPKVVGGNYNVLAVDIYKHVVGQQDFGMGAVVSIVLLLPAAAAFVLERIIQSRQTAAVTARSVPLKPKPVLVRDFAFTAACTLIAGFILLMVFMAGCASLFKLWPYDFSLTLGNYRFEGVGGGGYAAYWNSVRMACYTALFGTIITFASAYLAEKIKEARLLRQGVYLLSIMPLALPGLVIGIAYIFLFNAPSFRLGSLSIPNILNPLYGTMAILVVANIVHFYTVSFLTATTALRQLDNEFEAVSDSLGVPFYKTFMRVTVPVCLPAIIEIALFYFVNAMATVSAVIFLYSSDTRLASVAVVNMDDAGDTAPAAAMCMLIVGTNIVVRVLLEGVRFFVTRKTDRWRSQ